MNKLQALFFIRLFVMNFLCSFHDSDLYSYQRKDADTYFFNISHICRDYCLMGYILILLWVQPATTSRQLIIFFVIFIKVTIVKKMLPQEINNEIESDMAVEGNTPPTLFDTIQALVNQFIMEKRFEILEIYRDEKDEEKFDFFKSVQHQKFGLYIVILEYKIRGELNEKEFGESVIEINSGEFLKFFKRNDRLLPQYEFRMGLFDKFILYINQL